MVPELGVERNRFRTVAGVLHLRSVQNESRSGSNSLRCLRTVLKKCEVDVKKRLKSDM